MDPRLRTPVALVVDLGLVALFALVGRSAQGDDPAQFLARFWPFAVGALIGWVVVRGWRDPMAMAPTSFVVTAGAVVVGVLVRSVSGRDEALPLLLVAGFTLGAFLIGWRVLLVAGERAATRPPEIRMVRRRRQRR